MEAQLAKGYFDDDATGSAHPNVIDLAMILVSFCTSFFSWNRNFCMNSKDM